MCDQYQAQNLHCLCSDTRVDLGERVLRREVLAPLAAGLLVLVEVLVADEVLLLAGALEEVDAEAAADVPGNVAVEEPIARVVRLEGDDEPAVAGQHGHVAAGWILEVQAAPAERRRLSHLGRVAEDQKVVSVQVHRVRQEVLVLNHPVRVHVLLVDDVDVLVGRVRRVALEHVVEHGAVPVDVDVVAVDLPDERGWVEGHLQVPVRVEGEVGGRTGDNGNKVGRVLAGSVVRWCTLGRWQGLWCVRISEDSSWELVERSATKVAIRELFSER